MRRWEREVLLILEEEIAALQSGRSPQLPEEFCQAFLRFGREPRFYMEMPPQDATLIEDAAHLPYPEENPLWRTVYLHELVEAVLVWEGRPPYCYPPEPPDVARHRIAVYFEKANAPKE